MKLTLVPTTENTINFNEYQTSSPEKYSLDDKLVVFAQGRFHLGTFPRPHINIIASNRVRDLLNSDVTVYVVSDGLVISKDSLAVEVAFSCITLYGVQEKQLLLQIQSNELVRVESLIPIDYEPTVDLVVEEAVVEAVADEAAAVEDAARGSSVNIASISELYEIMDQYNKAEIFREDFGQGEDFDGDDFSHDGDFKQGDGFQSQYTDYNEIETNEVSWNNFGDADDLGQEVGDGEAAMNVDVSGPSSGVKRSSQLSDNDKRKRRIRPNLI